MEFWPEARMAMILLYAKDSQRFFVLIFALVFEDGNVLCVKAAFKMRLI